MRLALVNISAVWLLTAVCSSAALALGAEPSGDPQRGEQVYQRCMACHALTYDRVGPHHCNLIGRRAGSVPEFQYSPAMLASGIIWTTATLDAFLTAPTNYVEGTSMGYAGVEDAADRQDLIAFLAAASADPVRCATANAVGGSH